MARTRNRYRAQWLSAEDKEKLLLVFGDARDRALRYERSLELDDPRRALGTKMREAIDAIAIDLTGDKEFFFGGTTTSSSGYTKMLAAIRARDGKAA
jgi:hypothetical protein